MDGDVDWNAIARATAGASGAELANIVNEGALRAVRRNREDRRPRPIWRRAWRRSSPAPSGRTR